MPRQTVRHKCWILAAIIWSICPLAGCGDTDSAAHLSPPDKIARVKVVQLRPEPLEEFLILLGTTEPETDVRVSSESTGTVLWVGVEEGDHVNEKTVIARIDTATSGARFDKAKAAKRLATEQVRRRRELLRKGVLAQEEFDRIKTELERTAASLKEMQVGVRNGVIRAPVGGVVNARHIDKGERVEEGMDIVEIVDLSKIRITVKVSETNIPFIKKDSRAKVRIDAIPGRVWGGRVEFVSLKADEKTKTFKVKVIIDNPDSAIRAGMLARVRLLKRSLKDTIVVPLFSIINQGGERLVYVVENGVAHMRIVSTGAVTGDKVQVLEGLTEGDFLVTSGQMMVEDGMKVVVQ